MRERIERAVDLVGRAASWLALAIVALMATDVVLRYLFSIGSVWAQELEWHLLTPLIMFGIPYALLKGDHVRVDVLYAKFSEKNQLRVEVVSQVLCILVSAAIVWLAAKYVLQAWSIDEGSPDPGGLPHRWALKAIIPAGFVLLILQSAATLAGVLEKLRRLRGAP